MEAEPEKKAEVEAEPEKKVEVEAEPEKKAETEAEPEKKTEKKCWKLFKTDTLKSTLYSMAGNTEKSWTDCSRKLIWVSEA